MGNKSEVRDKIIEMIGNTQDESIRPVLMVVLHMFEELINKIDTFIADEQLLRETVLNQHSSVHDAHHSWVATKIAEEMTSRQDRRRLSMSLLEKAIVAVGSIVGVLVLLGLGAYVGKMVA